MKKRNKAYRPKAVSPMGGLRAISINEWNSKPLPPERQANTVIAYHTSIDAMVDGRAEELHFDTLIYALNISAILCERGLGKEHVGLVEPALQGLQRCRERWLKSGRFGLDGDALNAVREAARIHEAHIEIATQGELESAMNEMYKRIDEQKTPRLAA